MTTALENRLYQTSVVLHIIFMTCSVLWKFLKHPHTVTHLPGSCSPWANISGGWLVLLKYGLSPGMT